MKKYISLTLMLVSIATSASASAQVAKIKDGDKFTTLATDYVAQGRDALLDSTKERTIVSSFTEKDGVYMTKSELGGSTVVRKTLVMIARENAQGVKTDIPSEQQFNWMPPGGDFSKPWAISFSITHPNCGNGKVTHEATAKPVKYTLFVNGKSVELSAFEINFNGKWDFNNHCRSGKQLERFVYSPELDFIVERDSQNYDGRGFFNRGNNFKLKAVN